MSFNTNIPIPRNIAFNFVGAAILITFPFVQEIRPRPIKNVTYQCKTDIQPAFKIYILKHTTKSLKTETYLNKRAIVALNPSPLDFSHFP